jgi:hypothetical protein
MGLFNRKTSQPEQQAGPAKPHVVDDMLHLDREPPISRVVWSDGHIDYVKVGEDIPKR